MYKKAIFAFMLGLGLLVSRVGLAQLNTANTWEPQEGQVITFLESQLVLSDSFFSRLQRSIGSRSDFIKHVESLIEQATKSGDSVIISYEIKKVDKENKVFSYTKTHSAALVTFSKGVNPGITLMNTLKKDSVNESLSELVSVEKDQVERQMASCPDENKVRTSWHRGPLTLCDVGLSRSNMVLISNEIPFYVYFKLEPSVTFKGNGDKVFKVKVTRFLGLSNPKGMKVNH